MAFIYTPDGQKYESDFHFWYVHGFRPDPKLKEEIPDETRVETSESGLVHSERGRIERLGRMGRGPEWGK